MPGLMISGFRCIDGVLPCKVSAVSGAAAAARLPGADRGSLPRPRAVVHRPTRCHAHLARTLLQQRVLRRQSPAGASAAVAAPAVAGTVPPAVAGAVPPAVAGAAAAPAAN
eukprot:gene3445-4544_t